MRTPPASPRVHSDRRLVVRRIEIFFDSITDFVEMKRIMLRVLDDVEEIPLGERDQIRLSIMEYFHALELERQILAVEDSSRVPALHETQAAATKILSALYQKVVGIVQKAGVALVDENPVYLRSHMFSTQRFGEMSIRRSVTDPVISRKWIKLMDHLRPVSDRFDILLTLLKCAEDLLAEPSEVHVAQPGVLSHTNTSMTSRLSILLENVEKRSDSGSSRGW